MCEALLFMKDDELKIETKKRTRTELICIRNVLIKPLYCNCLFKCVLPYCMLIVILVKLIKLSYFWLLIQLIGDFQTNYILCKDKIS